MWDGGIDERHLYAALRLRVHTYERDGSDSKTVGSGTGFVVSREPFDRKVRLMNKDAGFLVTNRHVLDPDYVDFTGRKLDKVTVSGFDQPTFKGKMDAASATAVEFTVKSPQPRFPSGAGAADIAVIDLKEADIPGGCPELTELSNLHLANTNDFNNGGLHVGGQVLIPGYPGIDQATAARPILVSGTVASDPREAAEIGSQSFPGCVLCHSFSWSGMSGSPVFAFLPKFPLTWNDMEHGHAGKLSLVGVNRGHLRIGGTAEGALTYFVKSSLLAPLLRDMGAKGLLHNRDDGEED
jgi:hypothetical protein